MKRAIGFSGNALAPDHENADSSEGTVFRPYQQYRMGYTAQTYATPAPVVWEYRRNPDHSAVVANPWQWDVWTAYAGAATGGHAGVTRR